MRIGLNSSFASRMLSTDGVFLNLYLEGLPKKMGSLFISSILSEGIVLRFDKFLTF